jgi:hypothetical protein
VPNPAELAPSAVSIPGPELRNAKILDDATASGQMVRCFDEDDPQLATDPMPWSPYVTPDGHFFPKRGDRAVIGLPPGAPPVILAWWPATDEPDVPS